MSNLALVAYIFLPLLLTLSFDVLARLNTLLSLSRSQGCENQF